MERTINNTADFREWMDDFLKMCDGDISEEEYNKKWEPTEEDYKNKDLFPHGKCIDHRAEPYHDVYIYEDGYEEWEQIGD